MVLLVFQCLFEMVLGNQVFSNQKFAQFPGHAKSTQVFRSAGCRLNSHGCLLLDRQDLKLPFTIPPTTKDDPFAWQKFAESYQAELLARSEERRVGKECR